MNQTFMESHPKTHSRPVLVKRSMHELGELFIEALPTHIANLKIPGRSITEQTRRPPLPASIDNIEALQQTMHEVLCHPITQQAQQHAESAFLLLLRKDSTDASTLRFFNGWNETHKTTSLVSAKVIMRLAADAVSMPAHMQASHNTVMAHMHEVAKDDFGLGHKGHDGMYRYLTAVFGASDWLEERYSVSECLAFSEFLYNTGIAGHKAAMASDEYRESTMKAMMVSISSELWNGREYNFLSQFIEQKLLCLDPTLSANPQALRNAKGYVMGHSGEVENRHGLHALAAAQAFARMEDIDFDIPQLKKVMLDYNERVGKAFGALASFLAKAHDTGERSEKQLA